MANCNDIGPVYVSVREKIIKPPEIKRGTVLADRFVVSHKIGEGGISTAYLARNQEKGSDDALKIVNRNCPSAVSRLLHEKRIYDIMDDTSGVMKCYGLHYGDVGHVPVMLLDKEYAPGGTAMDWLTTYIDDPQHRLSDGPNLVKSFLRAVASLHKQGIVCSDLDLTNFVRVGDLWKICDLDLASCNCKNVPCKVGPPLWGTPVYMAPEAFDVNYFSELSLRADIYSAAIILRQILSPTALPPFIAKSYERIRQLHYNKRPPVLDDVDEYLVQISDRGLKKYPNERYGSIETMLDDLVNKKPEVAAYNDGHERFLSGKAKFNDRQYLEAEVELEKVLPEHEDYRYAEKLLADIKHRYDQVNTKISEKLPQLQCNQNLSGIKFLCSELHQIYPDHPSLRPIKAELQANAKKIDYLFEFFKASFECGDLKGIEGIFMEMQATDSEAEKTDAARKIVNVIDSGLDYTDDQLDIAIISHDHELPQKIHAEQGKIFDTLFTKEGIRKITSKMKKLDSGKDC